MRNSGFFGLPDTGSEPRLVNVIAASTSADRIKKLRRSDSLFISFTVTFFFPAVKMRCRQGPADYTSGYCVTHARWRVSRERFVVPPAFRRKSRLESNSYQESYYAPFSPDGYDSDPK